MGYPWALQSTEGRLESASYSANFLGNLTSETRRAFEAIADTASCRAGDVLFVEQEAPRGIFVVDKGRVKVSISSSEGKSLILRIAKPGDAVGLPEAVTGALYQANAEALESSLIKFVNAKGFQSFLQAHPDALLQTAKELAYEYRSGCEQVRMLGLDYSASKRLASFLLEWTSKAHPAKDGDRATLTLTHEEIGQMIGASRETVTRAFSEFKSHRLLILKGSTLVIYNRTALAEFAEGRGVRIPPAPATYFGSPNSRVVAIGESAAASRRKPNSFPEELGMRASRLKSIGVPS